MASKPKSPTQVTPDPSRAVTDRPPLIEELKAQGLEPVGMRIIGTKLTARLHQAFALSDLLNLARRGADEATLAGEALRAASPGLLEIMREERELCIQVLAGAGLPTNDEPIKIHSDGKWEPMPVGDNISSGGEAGLELGRRVEDSEEWFAATILRIIEGVEAAIRACNTGPMQAYRLAVIQARRDHQLGLVEEARVEHEISIDDPVAFAAMIENEAVNCVKILAASGLPTSDDYVVVEAHGSWRPSSEEQDGVDLLNEDDDQVSRRRGFDLALTRAGTPEFFAAEILRTIGAMRASMQQILTVGTYAQRLAALRERRFWKLEHEERAMAGHAAKKKLAQISPKGTEATKKKGSANYSGVVEMARSAIKSDPRVAGQPFKLADVVFRQNADPKNPNPIKGNKGDPLGVDAILRHIKKATIRGDFNDQSR